MLTRCHSNTQIYFSTFSNCFFCIFQEVTCVIILSMYYVTIVSFWFLIERWIFSLRSCYHGECACDSVFNSSPSRKCWKRYNLSHIYQYSSLMAIHLISMIFWLHVILNFCNWCTGHDRIPFSVLFLEILWCFKPYGNLIRTFNVTETYGVQNCV